MVAPFRRIAAGKRDEVRFCLVIEFWRLSRSRGIVQGTVESSRVESAADIFHGRTIDVFVNRDPYLWYAIRAFQKHARSHQFAGTVPTSF